jgi:nucleoside-diphosphate-sugar epimerase
MNSKPKIYVAGHRGMVGSAIVRALQQQGQANIVTRTHAELDLTSQAAVRAFFEAEKPAQVYLAAAKVGGIHANNTYPAEFIYQNLMMQANVIHEAWRAGVQKLLFLGSSCIYPKLAPQPMREDALLTGPLEPTNEPYAIAKIAGIKLCESYTYAAHTQPMQSHINVGCGQDITIRELAHTIGQVVGYQGQIEFDPSKPDGTPRKLMDSSRLNALGWQAKVALEDGLAKAYADFSLRVDLENYH